MPVTRSEYLVLVPPPVNQATLRIRRQRGEVAYAYRSADRSGDEFDELDVVALRIVEALAPKTTLKMAADLTNRFWPMWSDAVSVAETFPSENPIEHCYLVVANVGDHFEAMIGPLAQAVAKLPKASQLIAVSIHTLLADLRKDAKEHGVPLPERLAPVFGSPEYLAWRETLDDPAMVARTRAAVKGKTVVKGKA